MIYLKAIIFAPEVLSPQEANINIPVEDKFQDYRYERENWCKNMGLPQEMDINMAHRYSHLE